MLDVLSTAASMCCFFDEGTACAHKQIEEHKNEHNRTRHKVFVSADAKRGGRSKGYPWVRRDASCRHAGVRAWCAGSSNEAGDKNRWSVRGAARRIRP